ncbi:class 1 isoprenoid biosynthesis enzyme [Micromonospora tulbaghiae]|uniref:Class 1 isoprenoid biosynthesis enzyme n=1 Tax=Micromonospora tulbaghiae TaxID=479978 RepID=A0AAW4JQ43_9ACTN|nr:MULTISPECIES: terpene synthase family protein [Micromonospora]KAB1905434.1 class 1 isoprenoid biosynthesis enzyme [Micromonospora sp. AMSO1212t]MBO4141057.1 class 1 isoprenoid biosynthesis enzyme [Micromonospora tulbaghiae]MDX5461581.1 terpene synthase family protein [Micromonospora tulbaghiae]SCE86905.1 Terpene synthase family, metal binding domain [Micromonospora tulbaghiae]
MTDGPTPDPLAVAAEQGRVCALAAQGQRGLRRAAAAHPELFPGDPFDATLFSSIAQAMAFSAPWHSAAELAVTNRAVLWGFAVDWLVDHQATSRAEVDRITGVCLDVLDGSESGDPLGRFLAELRDDVAAAPAYPVLRGHWRDTMARMLGAMAREWDWRRTGRPTLADYLANADNLAATVVNVAHWIHTGSVSDAATLARLVEVSDEVQRALRLVNDLGTHRRDAESGDLNALLLVNDPAEVERRFVEQVDHCRVLLAKLAGEVPREADFLSRQLGFTTGFYRNTDFWGVR